jgi:hypothetical protein
MVLISSTTEPLSADCTPNISEVSNGVEPLVPYVPTLKKIPPYWYPYRTFAKERWWNREILELVSTEFRDRSVEYYVSIVVQYSGPRF